MRHAKNGGGRVRLACLVTASALALALASCGSGSGSEASQSASATGTKSVTLNVYGAASLTEAFGEIEKIYEEANPGVDVVYNFAGSQDLVDQISAGAPADVLATADTTTMDAASSQNLVGEAERFTSNTLVLIVPAGNPAGVTGLDSSLDGAKLVICAREVPCGAATSKLTGLLDVSLSPVSQEQKVTDVRGKVASGEADAGIVYRTDALAAGNDVETIEIPRAGEVVNEYPAAVVSSSENRDEAERFVDLLGSPQGQAILEKHGFNVAEK
ncbi:MAG: molybdate ABC transporter substrate-binding protein [Actinomycetaceae bacterium]|nr:molybdate ABC transporter substrate-binding protein [Actinomycetaceae bacterium]